jgi:hypothetical protein
MAGIARRLGGTSLPMTDRVDIPRMLAELDFPSGLRAPVLRNFAAAADSLSLFVEGAARRPDVPGEQAFGIFHLLTRGLSDLVAGGHLLSHCYVVQAYSVMRPALDSCDLIELFACDPSEAELWVNTDKAHIDFAPAKVRKRLGQPMHDPVHGHFSESGSHPRFAGARLSGSMKVAVDDPTERVAVMRIGPTWREDPGTLFGWLFACNALSLLAFKARHLNVVAVAEPADWLQTYKNVLVTLREAVGYVGDELDEPEVGAMFDEGLSQLGAMEQG